VLIRTALEWVAGLAFFIPVSGRLNPVMWSLVVEVHFYLVLPLLFLLTKPLSAKVCLGAIAAFLFVVPVSIQTLAGEFPSFSPQIHDPFCTGLSCFCVGVAIAGVDALKLWNEKWARLGDAGWLVLLVSILGRGWCDLSPSAHPAIVSELFHWTFFLGSGCLLCYAAAPGHPRARWLCGPWLRWCGIISYEWYLFHQPLIGWGRELFGPAHGNVFRYALILGVGPAASVVVSALVYRWFSLPILKFGRSRARARHSAPVSA
jgi:peptidoglycan/LPS O-acetylase OafA/YrhL